MFASFLWTVILVTVCRADGSAVEHRLKPFWAPRVAELSEGERRRDGGDDDVVDPLDDGVMTMAAEAGFRYKTCIRKSRFGGFSKFILVAWAPAILGDLMDFSTERRRWGFNKNNFITNIAQPLAGVDCDSVLPLCNLKAMRIFQNGLDERKAHVQSKYLPFVSSSNIDFFVECALEEVPAICSEYKALVCPESEN